MQHFSSSNSELVKKQRLDSSLKDLLYMVCDTDWVSNLSYSYFLQNEVLLRKWVPQGEHLQFIGDPIYQVVAPNKLCNVVLQIAHDESRQKDL